MKTTRLAIIVFALLLTGCEARILGVDIGIRTPSVTSLPITEATMIATPPPAPLPTPSPAIEEPISVPERYVCFENNIAGTVWVRACPGTNCTPLGTLSAGEKVETPGVRKDDGIGTTWLHLTSPLDGWINIRYVCDIEKSE